MQAYEKAIEIDPNIKGFYKRYAEIVLAKGQEEKVITAMEGLIKSGEADFGTYNTLAEIYKGNKQYEKAIEYYNEALSLKPQDTDALTSLAECQKALGKVSTAIITYEQAVMMDSDVYEPYKPLAELYLKQGKEDKAISTYQKYLDKGGKSSEISLKVGNYLYEQEEYKEALKYLEDVSGKAAKDFRLRYRLMRVYHMKKDHKKVASIGEELRDRNPSAEKLKNILKWTADAYEGMKDMENALAIYDKYTKLKGVKEPDIDYKRARLREKDDKKLAIEIYKSNIDKYPDDVRNYVRLGLLYSKNEETLSQSTSILEKAASMATDKPQIWGKIAGIYGKLGNQDKELEAYEKYLKAEPKNFKANLRVGQILMNKGQVSESMIYLETANSIKPDNLDVMEALSKGYVRTNRIDEAIALMDKVKKKDPKNVKIRQHLFKLHMKKGNTKKALNEIEELVKKDPGPENMYMYARTLFEMEKYDDALDKVEDILATNPENLKALMLKAKIRMAEEEYEKAIESYKEVLYIDSENATALAGRGMAYLKMEKFLWADKFFKRALEADKECVDAYIGTALIAKARDQEDLFRENVKKAAKLDPYDPKVKELKEEL